MDPYAGETEEERNQRLREFFDKHPEKKTKTFGEKWAEAKAAKNKIKRLKKRIRSDGGLKVNHG